MASEEPLNGGITNAGQVVRDGGHVLRPVTAHTASIHKFLGALADAGFSGAPVPVGVDRDGRERLEFIEGDVPAVPYSEWSQSDTALASIAQLLRAMHDAAGRFDPSGLSWARDLADPADPKVGGLICHNDIELSNIVFRHGVAIAFVDFEFAALGRPVYDLAQMSRLCVPIEHEIDQKRMGWKPADRPARLRIVADSYGLDRAGRADLLTALDDAIDQIEAAARRSHEDGTGKVRASSQTGGMEKYDRRRRWWQQHRDEFAAALR